MLQTTPKTADGKSLVYPYAPYNEGKLDPQLTGWPLTDAEMAWAAKGEYERKPGHEVKKHLPKMWFVTPTAGRWRPKKGTAINPWMEHHAANIANVKATGGILDIALLGDSITQHWGGGWDGEPFNEAWQKHFGSMKTVNLGIGGDRMEHILWQQRPRYSRRSRHKALRRMSNKHPIYCSQCAAYVIYHPAAFAP
jgi:hypothetical protein